MSISVYQSRRKLGLTQSEFSKEVCLSRGYVSKVECGRSRLSGVQELAVECLLRRAQKFGEMQKEFNI